MSIIVMLQVLERTKTEENNTQVVAAFQQKTCFHCYSAAGLEILIDFKQQLSYN